MAINSRLKELRVNQGITQKQLSERIGVAKSLISYYESGDRFPSYDVLIKLARVFHVTTDFLLGINHCKTIDVSLLSDEEFHAILSVVDVMSNKN